MPTLLHKLLISRWKEQSRKGVKILRPDSQWWYVWRELLVKGWVKANMPDITTVQFQWAHRLIWVYYTVANCMSLLASNENIKQTALSGLRGWCSWLPIIPAVQANKQTSIFYPALLSGGIHFTTYIKGSLWSFVGVTCGLSSTSNMSKQMPVV